MRVHVGNAAASHDLAAFLRSRIDAIVDERDRDALEVSLIGSYNDAAMRQQIELAVKRWTFVRRQPQTIAQLD